jgi:hypothetical protein
VGVEGAARATPTAVADGGSASTGRDPSRPGAVGTPTWEEVAERYAGSVSRLAYSLTGDPDEACDLTQDVFARVDPDLDRYRPAPSRAGSLPDHQEPLPGRPSTPSHASG